MSVALVALDAVVELRTARGARRIPLAELFKLPGDTPQIDTHLARGEIITAVDLPSSRWQEHSAYLKVRDRASYAFALVSVAAGARDTRMGSCKTHEWSWAAWRTSRGPFPKLRAYCGGGAPRPSTFVKLPRPLFEMPFHIDTIPSK